MPFVLNRLLIGLVCLFISGCLTNPERNEKASAPPHPERWSTENVRNDPILTHWLDDFADPMMIQTVRMAILNNYDLKAAAARIDAARSRMRIEGSARRPQLSAEAGYRRQGGDKQYDETGAFEALFNLSWELDVWGRILARQEAAGQEVEATDADWRAARLSLAARTAQNYIELAEAREQVKVAEQSILDRGKLVELLRGRFRLGLAQALDLRLALTDLSDAKAQLAGQRVRVQNLSFTLETLLGRYPEGRINAAEKLPSLPDAVPAGLPSELLERRPDLMAAFARLSASDKRLESARKALLPRFTLTANGGTSSAALAEWVDPRAAAWNFALGLLQPVFTGGRLIGEIELQEAQVSEAWNSYKHTVLNAFREVEQTLAAENRLREQERALQEAIWQTDASRKLAVYSYQHGLIEILTLLDSYRGTLNAQSAHLSAQRQLLGNRIDLYLALGGDF